MPDGVVSSKETTSSPLYPPPIPAGPPLPLVAPWHRWMPLGPAGALLLHGRFATRSGTLGVGKRQYDGVCSYTDTFIPPPMPVPPLAFALANAKMALSAPMQTTSSPQLSPTQYPLERFASSSGTLGVCVGKRQDDPERQMEADLRVLNNL